MTRPIIGILLAAGSSTRFGEDKLLHQLADGTPVAVAAAHRLAAGVDRALAVVRPGNDRLPPMLEAAGLQVVVNERAADGMGSSLARGVCAARGAAGWVVALGDMPFVRPETIAAVARELAAGAGIAAPVHAGRRGHPVGFGPGFRRELAALTGDSGARDVLARHANRLVLVPVDDAGALQDIDHPNDLGGDA
ncbi:MAG: nucleotidyltransferase family protein [Chromatiales bacterium]|jgi:molybdenum cofactor cytidylyltransferase